MSEPTKVVIEILPNVRGAGKSPARATVHVWYGNTSTTLQGEGSDSRAALAKALGGHNWNECSIVAERLLEAVDSAARAKLKEIV